MPVSKAGVERREGSSPSFATRTTLMYIKYPRTYHLPWSEGWTSDDKVLTSTNMFEGQNVIVTEKMDGENTTMYNDHIHARSINSGYHPSRTWVKAFWSLFSNDIPNGMRICGENLYAKHSIYYEHLPSYFLGFSIWQQDVCLSWKETVEWFQLLNIIPVPILYEGVYNKEIIEHVWSLMDPEQHEGYVIRLTHEFPISQFPSSVAKYVRKEHVRTDTHWSVQYEINGAVA